MKTIVIGIAGGSGSGKTTLAHKLKDALCDDIVLRCHDFYYKAHDDMPFEERQKQMCIRDSPGPARNVLPWQTRAGGHYPAVQPPYRSGAWILCRP